MMEWLFPVVGALVVFLIAVPLLTLVASAALLASRLGAAGVDRHASPWRYALTLGPTLGPVLWLVSAAVHQSESGAPLAACLIDHLSGELCHDLVLFGFVLIAVLAAGALSRMNRQQGVWRRIGVASSEAATGRVAQACWRQPELSRYSKRIIVVQSGRAPVCTRGLVRPVVEIEADVVHQLDDAELDAVLLHELGHVRAGDPLRFFIAQVALTLNPLGRLLYAEWNRYCFGREVLCDRGAVELGADPLALARSIVAVAGKRTAPAFSAALGGHGVHGIRVRVHLLLSYAERLPTAPGPRRTLNLLGPVALALILLPHWAGTGPLDALHLGIESTALLISPH